MGIIPQKELKDLHWQDMKNIGQYSYECPYCGRHIVSSQGYEAESSAKSRWEEGARSGEMKHVTYTDTAYIRICPWCHGPTFIGFEKYQFPVKLPGIVLENLPTEINTLFTEARTCAGDGAYTGAVLLCRTILMHIAVEKGAKPRETFHFYVDYLLQNGYIPPEGRGWVDYIREKGNDATHKIELMDKDDAFDLLTFVEMLLKTVYLFPLKVKEKKDEKKAETKPEVKTEKTAASDSLIGKIKDKLM